MFFVMKERAVIIIPYDMERAFLLQHRSDDASLMPGRWAFFGGKIEEGETPEDAIKREAYEELLMELDAPELIFEQDFTEGDVSGHLYVYVEYYNGDKDSLKLQEGQGWGWYKESEVDKLKMIGRDRKIIGIASDYLACKEKRKI